MQSDEEGVPSNRDFHAAVIDRAGKQLYVIGVRVFASDTLIGY